MITWLAVAFFCGGGDCAFYRSTQLFETREQCLHHLSATLEILEDNSEIALGNCFDIRIPNETRV